MHVYRDSIRYSSDRTAVESAIILTPVELARKIYDPKFQCKHGIGAIRLAPQMTEKLKEILTNQFAAF